MAAGGGRPKGSVNRITKTLKEAILLAAEVAGDEIAELALENGKDRPGGLLGYLTFVASTEPKAFCALLGRVLPLEIAGAGGGPLEVVFRTVYEDDGGSSGGSAPLIIDG
ncbi:hypothetical protein ACRAVF_19075 [Bradyrhizobium oligotrophicum S58]